jgi:hypothetical protein
MTKEVLINKNRRRLLPGFLLTVFITACSANPHYQSVLALQPDGYWPADEGDGTVLHDRSGRGNDGTLHGAGWDSGYLNFTKPVQYALIPSIAEYRSNEISLGGWVFTRSVYDKTGIHLIGNGYRNTGITLDTLYHGKRPPPFETPSGGISVVLAENGAMMKFGSNDPALRSESLERSLTTNHWEHILVTVQEDIARLYINGELVQEKTNISYDCTEMPFVVGIQADLADINQWWNRSLNGQVADLVLFNRALTEEEIKRLAGLRPAAVSPAPPATVAMESPAPVSETKQPLSVLIADLKGADAEKKLAAVRSLAQKRSEAGAALPMLISELQTIIDQEGAHLLRSNELLRNALIWSLQTIDPSDPASRTLLGIALAKPVFDSLDLSDPFFSEVVPLIEQERYMDALELYYELPLSEEVIVSPAGELPYTGQVNMKGDIHYSPIVHHEGCTYIAGVKWVTPEELAEHPRAADWEERSDPWPARAVITKIAADGRQTTATIEGDDFIFSASDAKMHGWSLGVDRDGYLHLTGAMHNIIMNERFIPGSLEKLGLTRSDDFRDTTAPNIMYWVSEKPGDISSFKFMGRRDNPRTIPVFQGLNYMSFERDRLGNLYLFGRIYTQGMQAFGLCRYDPDTRRWTTLGGFAPDMKKADPAWANLQIISGDMGVVRSLLVEADNPRTKAIFWDKGSSWYAYSRGCLRFDRQNRMHFSVPLRAIGPDGIMVSYALYAYSDDLGETFHRADGSPINALPMSASPGPGQADVLGEAGSTIVYFDASGIPGVWGGICVYWHAGLGKWQSFKPPVGGLSNVFPDRRGIITWRSEGGESMWRSAGHGLPGKKHEITQLPFDKGRRNYTNNMDWRAFYDDGTWMAVQVRYQERIKPPTLWNIKFTQEQPQ